MTTSSPHPSVQLSVVIPACNEAKRLGASLGRVVQYLAARPDSFEVIVVDDGSTDGTLALAQVAELPITWRNSEGSRVRPVRHSLQMLRELLRSRQAARGEYQMEPPHAPVPSTKDQSQASVR